MDPTNGGDVVREPRYLARMARDGEPAWLFEASGRAGTVCLVGFALLTVAWLAAGSFTEALGTAMLSWLLATLRWYQR